MNIKKIIKEELDNFDWAKDIQEPILIEPGSTMIISFCDSIYTVFDDIFRNKLRELHGDIVDNWFEGIDRHPVIGSEYGGKIVLYIDGNWQWDDCVENDIGNSYWDYTFTTEEFLRVKFK